MKHIFLIFFIIVGVYGSVIKSPIISVNKDETEATISIDKIDIGVSGFVVHTIAKDHEAILKSAVQKVIILTAPSGAGKTSITKYLLTCWVMPLNLQKPAV